MNRLDLAAERFAAALGAVENAAAPLTGARDSAARVQARLAELSAEREALLSRIAELEEELQSLAGISEEVEDRLDGAIGEIRSALGR